MVACLAAVVLGLLVGVTGSFSQERGLLAAAVAVAVLVLAVVASGLMAAARSGAGLAFVSWFLVVAALSLGRPEGDVIIAARVPGYLWLYGGSVLGGVALLPDYRRLASRGRTVASESSATEARASAGRAGYR